MNGHKKIDLIVRLVLAGIVIAGFFVVFWIMLTYGFELSPTLAQTLNMMTGALISAFTLIIAYWFSSSTGSKEKTESMTRLLDHLTGTGNGDS